MSTTTTTTTTTLPHQARKSVENTVFIRFQPPSSAIRRHHVEDVFSEVGPIKKCSIIHNATSSYGFVKYTAMEDAQLAAVKIHQRKIRVDNGITVTVHCEQALHAPDLTGPRSKRRKNPEMMNDRNKSQDYNNSDRYNINQDHENNGEASHDDFDNDPRHKKKTNRLILRNLSFYAKEKDIRQVLAPLGELLEVHIPRVTAAPTSNGMPVTHRGFAFITFASEKSIPKCLKLAAKGEIIIKDRAVQVSRSLHKTAHQAIRHKNQSVGQNKNEKLRVPEIADAQSTKEDDDDDDEEMDKYRSNSDNDDNDSHSEEEASLQDDHSDEGSVNDESDADDSTAQAEKHGKSEKDETSVKEKRCLFLRNLPFDCTRHDIFETFRQFGFVTAIYIVKDKETGKVPRGTAFVSFQTPEQANKALEAAVATLESASFVSQRNATLEEHWESNQTETRIQGIVLKGRRLLVDLAVDKSTAATLTVGEKKTGNGEVAHGKDRRNLYLKGEGRVENDEKSGIQAWDELPEMDKVKRQTAWSEKNTKLRSPLFFINPHRLSFRNLAKHVDEAALKQLCVDGIQRGLERKLVTAEDQIAHWKASGEMTTREILARIQKSAGEKSTSNNNSNESQSIMPSFDTKNIKQYIPALHIHRDFAPGSNKNAAPSRGFGFVEFEHHIHALACLRELNNNPKYSAQFATGGRQADAIQGHRMGKKKPINAPKDDALLSRDGKVRTPRLIVEFTVENKAKAKQQAAHRAHQQENQKKQVQEKEKKKNDFDLKKGTTTVQTKSRGAKQREKKRKQLENGGNDAIIDPSLSQVSAVTTSNDLKERTNEKKKTRGVKPPKKQKIDKKEEKFSKLVETYKMEALAIVSNGEKLSKQHKDKRWFE